MVRVMQANNEPRRWKLRDALRVKAGMSDREIDQLIGYPDSLNHVELVVALEDAYNIEIEDESFGEKRQ
jgi:acyl carrier protein